MCPNPYVLPRLRDVGREEKDSSRRGAYPEAVRAARTTSTHQRCSSAHERVVARRRYLVRSYSHLRGRDSKHPRASADDGGGHGGDPADEARVEHVGGLGGGAGCCGAVGRRSVRPSVRRGGVRDGGDATVEDADGVRAGEAARHAGADTCRWARGGRSCRDPLRVVRQQRRQRRRLSGIRRHVVRRRVRRYRCSRGEYDC